MKTAYPTWLAFMLRLPFAVENEAQADDETAGTQLADVVDMGLMVPLIVTVCDPPTIAVTVNV